jgi:hypothetical protein
VIVGAHALALHGLPRNTQDIDVFVSDDAQNISLVLEVLESFGFGGMHTADDFTAFGVRLGTPPVCIDLLVKIDSVGFEEAEATAEHRVLDGIPVNIINRELLIRNKRGAGRPKDLADVYTLEQTGK